MHLALALIPASLVFFPPDTRLGFILGFILV
jgi:hypothetical protein